MLLMFSVVILLGLRYTGQAEFSQALQRRQSRGEEKDTDVLAGAMRNGKNTLPISLILTALFLLFGALKQFIPSQRFVFTCFFLYIVLLPGYLATLRLVPWTRGALRLLASFIFGTVIAFATLFIASLFHLDIRIIAIVAPAVVIILSLWESPRSHVPETSSSGEYEEIPRENRLHEAILVALILAVSLMILLGGDPLIYTSDSADHIAYIRTVSRTHEAFPEQFYYRDGGILTHDIRKGMGQALWGALNALTGSHDAATVWPLMSLISSVFTLLALFCAGLVLFGSASIGLIASILFMLFYGGGLRGYQLAMSASGGMLGRTFYIAALAFLPLSMESSKSGYFLLAVLSAFVATCTHITYFALALYVTALFILTKLVTEHSTERTSSLRRGLLVFAAIVLINIPYLALRYIRDYAPNNAIHTQVQGVLYLTEKLYILNPLEFVKATGPLGILSLVALLVLLRKSKNDKHLRLLLFALIAVYFLLFNPLWFPFLFKKMSYLLIRFEFAVPSMIVCAYLLRELWAKLRRRTSILSPIGATLAFIAAVALLGYPLMRTPLEFAYGGRALHKLTEASYRNLYDLFAFIEKECPQRSTVASDPITSFGIPAFTDQYVISPYDQHATPNDSTAVQRIIDCRRIFDPRTSMAEIRDILVTYGAEYLVINGRIPPYIETLYWKPDRARASELSERLRDSTSPFRVVFEHAGVTMAKLVVCPTCKAIVREPAHPSFLGDSLDARAMDRLPSSGIRGIRIAEVRLSRTEAARGDTIDVDITWVAAEKCPFSSYIAYLRFDTDFPKNALYRPFFGKPYRKLVERFTGHRFRFRVDFQPLRGITPPDTWPLMHEIRDSVRVSIPRDVVSGAYAISLKLMERPQIPNYVLKDILTDEDLYSGARVATIRIK